MIAIQRRAVVDEYRQFSFSRNSVAFGQNGRLYYPHQARFETVSGRTGVLVEESTTNLRVCSDLMDSPATTVPGGEITVSTVSVPLLGYQTQVRRVSRTGSTNWAFAEWSSGITAQAAHAISVYIKSDTLAANEQARLELIEVSANPQRLTRLYIKWGSGGTIASVTPGHANWANPLAYGYEPAQDGWYRVWLVCPADVNPSMAPRVRINPCDAVSSVTDKAVFVGGVQVEQKNYPTSLMPTSGSATTRAAETLTVPTSVIDLNRGTAELWVYLQAFHSLKNFAFLDGRTDNNSIVLVLRATASGLNFAFGTGVHTLPWGSVTVPGWAYMAVRWDNGTWAAFYNGSKLFEFTYTPNQPLVGLCVGKHGRFDTDYANTVIGPVRISSRARTDQEIAAAYAAGTLTADADTTLLLPFTGPDAQRGARVLYVPAVGF